MYAPDNLCLFEFLSLALHLPEMPTSSGQAIVPPQEKEHNMGVVQSTDKIYSPLLIFNCGLIGLITGYHVFCLYIFTR